jgi:hypothetical protein
MTLLNSYTDGKKQVTAYIVKDAVNTGIICATGCVYKRSPHTLYAVVNGRECVYKQSEWDYSKEEAEKKALRLKTDYLLKGQKILTTKLGHLVRLQQEIDAFKRQLKTVEDRPLYAAS